MISWLKYYFNYNFLFLNTPSNLLINNISSVIKEIMKSKSSMD